MSSEEGKEENHQEQKSSQGLTQGKCRTWIGAEVCSKWMVLAKTNAPQKTNGVLSPDISHLWPSFFAEEEEQHGLFLMFPGFVSKEMKMRTLKIGFNQLAVAKQPITCGSLSSPLGTVSATQNNCSYCAYRSKTGSLSGTSEKKTLRCVCCLLLYLSHGSSVYIPVIEAQLNLQLPLKGKNKPP